jgi:hypothetical protein
LGHGELDSLLAQGARLSLDEAVDYALGADLPSTPA